MRRIIDSSSLSLNHKGEADYPLLITPEVFQQIGYRNLPKTEKTIVFFGFDRLNPLYLPKNHHFDGDVWAVGSIIGGMQGVSFKGIFNMIQCDINTACNEATYGSIRTMDQETYDSLREYKIKNKINDNRAIVLNSDIIQFERLHAVMRECPLYDFKEACDDSVVTVPVELKGPYAFDVPRGTVFKEKVTVLDIFNQQFHKEVFFEKDLFILGIY